MLTSRFNARVKPYALPFGVWLTQLTITLLITFLFVHMITPGRFGPPQRWTYGLAAWDGNWYLQIAEHGYTSDTSTAFFPFYPLLIRLVHDVLGMGYLRSAVVISNVAFLFALIFLHSLIKAKYGEKLASKVLWLAGCFPAAFFYNMAYTESVELLCLILFFYLLGKNRWYGALSAAFCATAIHDLGIVLAFPALIYWWKGRDDHRLVQSIIRLCSIGIIPLSLVLYMVYLSYKFADPLAFIHAHSAWNAGWVIPIWSVVKEFGGLSFHTTSYWDWNFSVLMVINGLAALAFAVLTVICLFDRQQSLGIKLFMVVTLLLSISTATSGETQSYARYVSIIFPGYLYLAKLFRSETPYMFILFVMFSLKILLTGMFANGYWVT